MRIASSDEDLLEQAFQVSGLPSNRRYPSYWVGGEVAIERWNAFENDDDAFRLGNQACLNITHTQQDVRVTHPLIAPVVEEVGDDRDRAVRRALVCAAAELYVATVASENSVSTLAL